VLDLLDAYSDIHVEYLVVFIVVQNLVAIDVTVLIIWNFDFFFLGGGAFGLKTPIFTTKITVLWEFKARKLVAISIKI